MFDRGDTFIAYSVSFPFIKEQLEMIVGFARNNVEGNDIRAMLKLIAKTDEWEQDFKKIQDKRR